MMIELFRKSPCHLEVVVLYTCVSYLIHCTTHQDDTQAQATQPSPLVNGFELHGL